MSFKPRPSRPVTSKRKQGKAPSKPSKGFTWRKGLRWSPKHGKWKDIESNRLYTTREAKSRREGRPAAFKSRSKGKASWRKGLKWVASKGRWKDLESGKLYTTERAQTRDIEHRMKSALKQVQLEFKMENPNVPTKVRLHRNKDGSIDAEFRVEKLPRGYTPYQAFVDIADMFPSSLEGVWISNGLLHTDTAKSAEASADRRYRGMLQAGTNYQRMFPHTDNQGRKHRSKTAVNFQTAGDITENMKAHHRKKASQVYVRLHWNKDNKKPTR